MSIITNPFHIELLRWGVVRNALSLEMRTGMKRSNSGRTTLQIARDIVDFAPDEWLKSKHNVYLVLDATICAYEDYFMGGHRSKHTEPFERTYKDNQKHTAVYSFVYGDLEDRFNAEKDAADTVLNPPANN